MAANMMDEIQNALAEYISIKLWLEESAQNKESLYREYSNYLGDSPGQTTFSLQHANQVLTAKKVLDELDVEKGKKETRFSELTEKIKGWLNTLRNGKLEAELLIRSGPLKIGKTTMYRFYVDDGSLFYI